MCVCQFEFLGERVKEREELREIGTYRRIDIERERERETDRERDRQRERQRERERER